MKGQKVNFEKRNDVRSYDEENLRKRRTRSASVEQETVQNSKENQQTNSCEAEEDSEDLYGKSEAAKKTNRNGKKEAAKKGKSKSKKIVKSFGGVNPKRKENTDSDGENHEDEEETKYITVQVSYGVVNIKGDIYASKSH